jgi:catechol 2,3-dioxygenase-like lactoylglutathione lyase family enzyme
VKTQLFVALLLASTLTAGTAAAQPAPYNEAGVTMGHWHLAPKDLQADEKVFLAMGGKLYMPGGQPLIMFPGLYISLILGTEKGDGGTVGSVVNHVGFIVDNVQMRTAQWKAAGVTVLPGGALPNGGGNRLDQAFVETPDGVRMEILEDKTQTVPIRNDHIHFAMPAAEIPKAQAWYARVFGGQPATRNNAPVVNLPGVQLRFNTAGTKQAPTRGRVFDHFGFDVPDHAAFMKRLEAQGITLDQPASKGATGNTITYITDPWGTRIEIVQRLPIGPEVQQTAASAQSAPGGTVPAAQAAARGQGGARGQGAQQEQPYPRLPAPPVKSPPDTMAPDIPGVVAGGTPVHLIRDLFHGTESPIAMLDGSVLFTEQDAGSISTFVDNSNRTIGLAYDTKGRLIGAESHLGRIGVLYPTKQTLVDTVDGLYEHKHLGMAASSAVPRSPAGMPPAPAVRL